MPAAPYRAPPGTHDVVPPASARWQALLARFAAAAGRAGYGLLQSPLIEDAAVFQRMNTHTDVVSKEMYTFEDRGGRRLALRPEGTASVVRAFVQHRPSLPWKVWYATPSFRYERPQAGRYRQHHQLGAEAIGPDDPDVDVEVIALAFDLVASLGVRRFVLLINSIGDPVCRPPYLTMLTAYLLERRDRLCDEHRERAEQNPLRVLDCKRDSCREATRGAPRLVEHLCAPCAAHFQRLQEGLRALGLPFVVETRLVRGFDYYTRTTFELQASALEGAQNGIGGGGRYDGLVEMLGGPPTPAVGFGLGVERLLLACDAEGAFPGPVPTVQVWVVDVCGGEAARDLTGELRRAGIGADRAFGQRSMRAQMRLADRSGARLALIVGEEEAAAGSAAVRPLRGGGDQERVARAEVVARVRQLLRA